MKCLVSDDAADQCLCITGSDRSHVFFPVARGPMPDSAPRLNTSFKKVPIASFKILQI